MSTSRAFDHLQSFNFWLTDISVSPRPPFFVLGGALYGFNSITMPEITLQTESLPEYNHPYPEKVITGAEIGDLTLTRGVKFYDSSFYNWIERSIEGTDRVQRNLLLIQYTGMASWLIDYGLSSLSNAFGADLANLPFIEGVGSTRLAPGKMWALFDCIPTRYKAGADLDGTSSEVSIAELDIAPRSMKEISLSIETVSGII